MKTLLQHATTLAIGVWFGYVLLDNLAPVEPAMATNLAEYNIKYQQCMKLVKNDFKCINYADENSQVCVNCE